MDDLRFRSQTSPRNESPMNSLVSHPRNASRLPAPQGAPQHSNDHRSNLPRRFTTDSGRIPTLTTLSNTLPTLASPPRAPEPSQDYNVSSRESPSRARRVRIHHHRLCRCVEQPAILDSLTNPVLDPAQGPIGTLSTNVFPCPRHLSSTNPRFRSLVFGSLRVG